MLGGRDNAGWGGTWWQQGQRCQPAGVCHIAPAFWGGKCRNQSLSGWNRAAELSAPGVGFVQDV